MEKIIKIRFMFGPWINTSATEAIAFAGTLYKGITNTSSPEKKLDIINKRHIQGAKIRLEGIKHVDTI